MPIRQLKSMLRIDSLRTRHHVQKQPRIGAFCERVIKKMDFEKLTIDNLLRFMVEQKASDLHIKPMRPPLMRLKGKLLPLKCDVITPEDVQKMLHGILNERLRTILDRDMAGRFRLQRPRCLALPRVGVPSTRDVFGRVPARAVRFSDAR